MFGKRELRLFCEQNNDKKQIQRITSSLSGSFWSPQTHDMSLVFGILPPRWDCWRCLRFHFQYNLLIVVSQFPNGSPGGISYLVGRRVSFGEQAHFIQMIYIYKIYTYIHHIDIVTWKL